VSDLVSCNIWKLVEYLFIIGLIRELTQLVGAYRTTAIRLVVGVNTVGLR